MGGPSYGAWSFCHGGMMDTVVILMIWEGRQYRIVSEPKGITPIDLCEQIGRSGRDILREILVIHYRNETREHIKSIEKKKSFKTLNPGDRVVVSGYDSHGMNCTAMKGIIVNDWPVKQDFCLVRSDPCCDGSQMTVKVHFRQCRRLKKKVKAA